MEDPQGSQSDLQTESRRVPEKSEIITNKQTNSEKVELNTNSDGVH